MILEPLESLNSQLFFFMISRYLHDSDRYSRICGEATTPVSFDVYSVQCVSTFPVLVHEDALEWLSFLNFICFILKFGGFSSSTWAYLTWGDSFKHLQKHFRTNVFISFPKRSHFWDEFFFV